MIATAPRAKTGLFAQVSRAALIVSCAAGLAAVTPLAASLALTHPAHAEMPGSFADLAAKVSPSVVNISSSHKETVSAEEDGPEMPFAFPKGSPFEEFFAPFMNRERHNHPHRRQALSLGSGFIIDPAGYIATNHHVIEGADKISVTLSDGKEYPAKLIGTDPKTDLALLKIDAKRSLPAIEWGDSDKARIGDWVVAVGNPFGLGGTVTTGIVSARGRDIREGPFDDFLQIDAAINRGNSGGPAFDIAGHVIGINTAIFSPSGGNVGIGFAIPSNLAKPILLTLKDKGHIERGWLGVAIQDVTPDLAKGIGLGEAKGAIVSGIEPDSPAAKAGLAAGDVITSFNGQEIAEMRDLPRLVAEATPGSAAKLGIWRKGRTLDLDIAIGQMKSDTIVAANPDADEDGDGDNAPNAAAETRQVLGADLAKITPDLRAQFDLDQAAQGLVVTNLDPDSLLAEQGLRPGDVIARIANDPVATPEDFAAAVEKIKAQENRILVLLIERQGHDLFVTIDLAQA